MLEIYVAPDCEEILLWPIDPIALSEGDDGDDDFWGGVPFSLRDNFDTFED